MKTVETIQADNFSRQENNLIFDTHQVIKNFIQSGFTEQQAEAIINQQKSIIESNLANKKDITEIKREIVEVKKEIKQLDIKLTKEIKQLDTKSTREIKEVERRLTTEITQLRIDSKKDMEILHNKTIFRLGSVIVISIGILATLIKFF